ncbi:hypothetical protein BVI1335_70079 [Burkholderia vietnamiensis]|nr:hypothetical protein BVI1335_70079 [Burkholderia vietnamiensis]
MRHYHRCSHYTREHRWFGLVFQSLLSDGSRLCCSSRCWYWSWTGSSASFTPSPHTDRADADSETGATSHPSKHVHGPAQRIQADAIARQAFIYRILFSQQTTLPDEHSGGDP